MRGLLVLVWFVLSLGGTVALFDYIIQPERSKLAVYFGVPVFLLCVAAVVVGTAVIIAIK